MEVMPPHMTSKKGEGLTEKNSNENLETPHLAPALFSHLPGFYLKTGILNPSPFLPTLFRRQTLYQKNL